MNIANLNDDCLLEIFKYLSKLDKLRSSLVCKKWGYYLLKNLEISEELINKYKNDRKNSSKTEDFNDFLINILKICGTYVSTLYIKHYSSDFLKKQRIPDLVLKLSDHCKNIVKIYISGSILHIRYVPLNLEKLFENNNNIRSIRLNFILINTDYCFEKLDPNKIEELELFDVSFESENYLEKFFLKLENLKKFWFLNEYGVIEDKRNLVKALEQSNCENITDFKFDFSSYEFDETPYELLTVLSKQKKLLKIDLIFLKVNCKFLDKLPKDNLEHLTLTFLNDYLLHYPMCKFPNLKVLNCYFEKFTDKFMSEIIECSNLKELHISNVNEYLLTKKGESYFSRLQSLEVFKLFGNLECLDNILMELSKCKNLNKLIISSCGKFTDVGINSLSLLKKLNYLDVSGSDITNEQLINLIKNIVSLSTINIQGCEKISNDLIQVASDVKDYRKDKHYLKIIYNDKTVKSYKYSNLNLNDLKNISSLILFEKKFW